MAAKIQSRAALVSAIKDGSEVFRVCAKKLKILSAISWTSNTADEFFKKKEGTTPSPTYKVDTDTIAKLVDALSDLAPKLKGDHPVLQWLEKTRESYLLGAKLLLNLGTPSFYEISTQLYGNSRTKIFSGEVTNFDLATSISTRMGENSSNDISESASLKSAVDFAADLERRIKNRHPNIAIKVDITNDISAKVVAGTNRLRIRKDARFSRLEVDSLWNHEVESHSLTANNGLLQPNCDFLAAGGPRTTLTQEGLAVFFEMYGHSMSQRRFRALCDRVFAIRMAEDGASFIDLYRWYKVRTETDLEAFYAAGRVFRGGVMDGKAPFTKDGVYIAGLLGVFNFLQLAVKNQNRLLVESLINGRIALEDVGVIAWLRSHGILEPPKFEPKWLRNWEALLSFFTFNSIVNTIDLSPYQHYFDANSTLQSWDFGV